MTEEFQGILLEIDPHDSSPTKSVAFWILLHCKGSCTFRSPNVLLVIVRFRNDDNLTTNKEGRIESDTKLTNQVNLVLL